DVSDVFRAGQVGGVSFTAHTVTAQLTCRQLHSRWTSGGDHLAGDGQAYRSRGSAEVPTRQRLVTYALGLAGGLGVNTLSTDVGYRGAAAAIAAILISTN
ncbi:MAG: hypothetical protein ACRDRX_27250, partial [Pseudonocardiaceae bacterium]